MRISFFSVILCLPLVHVLANTTTNYFPAGTINPGFLRVLFMAAIILFFLFKYKIEQKNITIIVLFFLVYNLLLVLMNDEITGPLIVYIRMALPFFMLMIGYTIIKDKDSLEKLLKVYLVALSLLCLNYVLSNYFGLGRSAYLEDSFYMGGASAGLSNEIALFVLCGLAFVMINNEKRWNYFTLLVIGSSIIIMLLILRRGAFLTLAAGLIVFLYHFKFKYKIYKYLLTAGVMLIALFPYYSETLFERYEQRAFSRGGSIANYQVEGRYREIEWVLDDLKKAESTKRLFIGTHNLNSSTYFGGRELHVGYMAILHGSGIIGLLLFLSIITMLVKKESFYFRLIPKETTVKTFHALFWALIASLFAYLITSRLHGFSVTTPTFLLLGAILSVFKKKAFEKTNISKYEHHGHRNRKVHLRQQRKRPSTASAHVAPLK